jgi:hypothetical protein
MDLQEKQAWLDTMRRALEDARAETPPPSLKEIGRRLGYTAEGSVVGLFRHSVSQLAEVVTLDCLGEELKDETEVYWAHLPARQKIPFEHIFRPAAKEPKQMLDW